MRVNTGASNTISAPRLKTKSNSGERARSKKKNAGKEATGQRPKTSKSHRKEKQLQLNKVNFKLSYYVTFVFHHRTLRKRKQSIILHLMI